MGMACSAELHVVRYADIPKPKALRRCWCWKCGEEEKPKQIGGEAFMDARRLQSSTIAVETRVEGSRRGHGARNYAMLYSLVGAGEIEVRGERGVVLRKEQ
jgi:hypothetical protein